MQPKLDPYIKSHTDNQFSWFGSLGLLTHFQSHRELTRHSNVVSLGHYWISQEKISWQTPQENFALIPIDAFTDDNKILLF